jgi:uncharacterized protein
MFVLLFEKGDEVVSALENFARKNKVAGGQITAVGSLSDVTLGHFDWKSKTYKKSVEIHQQVQVLLLTGDLSYDKGRAKVHCQTIVAKQDGSVWGGHLMQAHVRPALEIILTEASQFYQRRYDHETGLALLRPEPQPIQRIKIG